MIDPTAFSCSRICPGAKYYIGWILHNWNDEKVGEILRQVKSAVTSHSTLLINDMLLPEAGITPFAASVNLVILDAYASRERRVQEWQKLLDNAGLVLRNCIIYNSELCHIIICAALTYYYQ